jgi:two-component system sensor histidine kinase YesM
MERKKVKRKRLKKRLLISIAFVLLVSMIISTAVSYLYFSKVVQTQVISDERAKLQQVSNQIKFLTEDIQNFSKSIIVDDNIQSSLHSIDYETTYDRVVFEDEMAKRLVFYNSLRTYIWSSYIRIEDGTFYGGVAPQSIGDLEKKFSAAEMQAFLSHPRWVYSDPYLGEASIKPGYVICFRADMLDVNSFGTKQGTLYLEIYLKYFVDQIESYAQDSENICLSGNDNKIIYKKQGTEYEKDMFEDLTKGLGAGTYKTKQGYLVCENIPETGWKISTIVTKQYLWERSRFVLVFLMLSYVISTTLILVITSRLMINITRPITRLSKQMEDMDYQTLCMKDMGEMIRTNDEIQTLYECCSDMLEEIRRGISCKMDYEKQKKSMEFDIMLSQINPHYLYNVLNTVMYLGAAKKENDIVEIVRSLIYTLQETIKVGEENIETTIEKELELTTCYLNIQKYRYPDRFSVNIHCQEELKDCLVAKTVIQPLVENALLHGIIPTEQKGIIEVCIERKGDFISISVLDDGVGVTEQQLDCFDRGEDMIQKNSQRRHLGIRNIRQRIQYLYGEPFGMWIRRRYPAGTVVEIHLPVKFSPKYKMKTKSTECPIDPTESKC